MPKADPRLIIALNQILVQELTAINQYHVNRARYKNLQFNELVEYIDERIADEVKHYNAVLDRIFYLRGTPVAGRLDPVNIAYDIPGTFSADAASETTAIQTYNQAIVLAVELKDDGTRKLLEDNLADEEDHLDDLQAKLDQVALTGLPVFLGQMI